MSFKKFMVGAVTVMTLGLAQASALELSGGVGLIYGGDFGGGLGGVTYSINWLGESIDYEASYTYNSYGINAFFDVQYAEIAVSYAFGSASYEEKINGTSVSFGSKSYPVSFLNIGVLGKFPVVLSDAMLVYPAIGIAYNVCLSAEDDKGRKFDKATEQFSTVYINFGGIYDQMINEKMFVRGRVIVGIGLPTKESDAMAASEKEEYEGTNVDVSASLGIGVTIGAAIGFKF